MSYTTEMIDRAFVRRRALDNAGIKTYEISPAGMIIQCLCCGTVSQSEKDIETIHCSYCDAYHVQYAQTREMEAVGK